VAEETAATPSEVVATGGELCENAGAVQGVASSVQSEGSGDGADGCAITPGDMKSYWAQLDWVAGTLDSYANWMGGLGNNLEQAGAKFQEYDQG
jgi:hypothetical protein